MEGKLSEFKSKLIRHHRTQKPPSAFGSKEGKPSRIGFTTPTIILVFRLLGEIERADTEPSQRSGLQRDAVTPSLLKLHVWLCSQIYQSKLRDLIHMHCFSSYSNMHVCVFTCPLCARVADLRTEVWGRTHQHWEMNMERDCLWLLSLFGMVGGIGLGCQLFCFCWGKFNFQPRFFCV